MEQLKGTQITAGPQPRFSEAFKRAVVKEFEQGLLNKDQLQRKYGLGGNTTILKWCRKYGKFAYPKQTSIGRPMKDPQKQKIKEQEAKLKLAEQKLKVYDKLIEVTNRELNQDIIKKIEVGLQKSLRQKKG
jgi:transposase-like protein